MQAVRTDLPRLPATPQQQRAELVRRRGELQRRVLQEAGGGVALFAMCTAIWAASGAGTFWPIWVALVVLIFVGRNAWRLYGPAPELDRVEQELEARRRRDARQRRRDYRRERRDSRRY